MKRARTVVDILRLEKPKSLTKGGTSLNASNTFILESPGISATKTRLSTDGSNSQSWRFSTAVSNFQKLKQNFKKEETESIGVYSHIDEQCLNTSESFKEENGSFVATIRTINGMLPTKQNKQTVNNLTMTWNLLH